MEARSTGSPLLPKPVEQFRNSANARPRVEEFYALNHANQPLDFVLEKKREYLPRERRSMTVWESLEYQTPGKVDVHAFVEIHVDDRKAETPVVATEFVG